MDKEIKSIMASIDIKFNFKTCDFKLLLKNMTFYV